MRLVTGRMLLAGSPGHDRKSRSGPVLPLVEPPDLMSDPRIKELKGAHKG